MQQHTTTDATATTPRGSVLPASNGARFAVKHIGWANRGRWAS